MGHLAGGGMNSKVRFSWDNKTGGGAEGAGESEDWTYNKVSPLSPFHSSALDKLFNLKACAASQSNCICPQISETEINHMKNEIFILQHAVLEDILENVMSFTVFP